jgi:hypothetical protein
MQGRYVPAIAVAGCHIEGPQPHGVARDIFRDRTADAPP